MEQEPKMDAKARRARQMEEVDRNFTAFEKRFAELYREHPGKVALMKGGEIVEFFDTTADALKAGRLQFGDDVFSVQTIDECVADLGSAGHEISHRQLWRHAVRAGEGR